MSYFEYKGHIMWFDTIDIPRYVPDGARPLADDEAMMLLSTPPTEAEEALATVARYKPELARLREAAVAAQLLGNTSAFEEISAEYRVMLAQMDSEV